jgi:hypothetical protein
MTGEMVPETYEAEKEQAGRSEQLSKSNEFRNGYVVGLE